MSLSITSAAIAPGCTVRRLLVIDDEGTQRTFDGFTDAMLDEYLIARYGSIPQAKKELVLLWIGLRRAAGRSVVGVPIL